MIFELRKVLASVSFILANSFAITSLGTSSWVVNSFSGMTRLGLAKICVLFKDQPMESESCEILDIPSHWAATLIFIVIGICLSFLTVLLLLASMWRADKEKIAKVMGFGSMTFFCFAAIIFPFGFGIKEIGGEPYKLPDHTSVGYSYYFFCGATLLLTLAVCLSNFGSIEPISIQRRQ